MNHIQRLTMERDEAWQQIREARDKLAELERYVYSSKFHEDNTIQIRTDLGPKLIDIRFVLIP